MAVLCVLVAVACRDAGERSGPHTLEVWFHASEGPERELMEEQVERFNESHTGITVLLRLLPEGPYEDQVAEAAVDGTLPDVLDVDRLTLAGGEAGPLLPMDDLLTMEVLDSLVTEIAVTGRVGNHLVGAPSTTEVMLLAADRAEMRAIGAHVPSGVGEPWTREEFEEVLRDSTAHFGSPALGLPGNPVELGMALEALVRSAGAPLVPDKGTKGHATAVDVLTAPAAVVTATIVSRWIRDGLAAITPPDVEEEPAPLALVRSGQIPPRHATAVPPDLGGGVASVALGHVWVIPKSSQYPTEAAELVSFLLAPDEVAATAAVTGGVPTVRIALDRLLDSALARHRAAALAARMLLAHQAPPVPVWRNPSSLIAAYGAAVTEAGEGARVRSALRAAANDEAA
jgi:multiple sugar transport system substrate-binding protein